MSFVLGEVAVTLHVRACVPVLWYRPRDYAGQARKDVWLNPPRIGLSPVEPILKPGYWKNWSLRPIELFWHRLYSPERWVGGCAAGTTILRDRRRVTQPTLNPPAKPSRY